MNRARGQDGFALVAVLLIMVVMLGLGSGLLLFANTQQHASARTGTAETAFNLAEAALNAQLFQLSRSWPATAASGTANPTMCTATTSTSTNYCPDPSDLSGYTVPASASCPSGTGADAWGAPAGTQWATYVRDDGAGTSQLFGSATDQSQPNYDANGDGYLWVRAVGVAGCTVETVAALVSQQLVPLSFPTDALSANWFATGNNGNKVLVDTKGSAAQAGVVSTRCTGVAPLSTCQQFQPGQVSPDINASPPTSSPILSASQLASVKAEAQANGTYYTTGSCPASITALTGAPTYIEGCGALSFTGNGSANSAAAPGWLVLADGTIDIGGTTTFYGTIYAVDGQGSSGPIVTTSGTGLIQGAVDVDGLGGVGVNASGLNLVYDATSFGLIKTYAGVTQVPNSFRLLPAGQ